MICSNQIVELTGAAAEEVVQRSLRAEQPAALTGGAHRSTDLSPDGKGAGGTGKNSDGVDERQLPTDPV